MIEQSEKVQLIERLNEALAAVVDGRANAVHVMLISTEPKEPDEYQVRQFGAFESDDALRVSAHSLAKAANHLAAKMMADETADYSPCSVN